MTYIDRAALGQLVERRPMLSLQALSVLLLTAESAVILLSAVATGVAWHELAYGGGSIETFAGVGALAALLTALPFLGDDDFKPSKLISDRRLTKRILLRWHVGLFLLAAVGFLTKTTAVYSRGWMVLFWAVGCVGLAAVNALGQSLIRQGLERGLVAPRRLMLVGSDLDVTAFWARRGAGADKSVVSVARIPCLAGRSEEEERAAIDNALRGAVEHARTFGIEGVLILPGSLSEGAVARCIEAVSLLPVAVHLDAGRVLDGASEARIERIGNISAMTLSDRPLGPLEALAKRVFDVAAASVGLLLISPVVAAVAILIKLDSKGPVFFLQRRHGYNQRQFRILKFRTMTVLEDGDTFTQARQGDSRITKIGAFLRKTNIDELPQLWNVLKGEMSLIGPRPHPVPLDRRFETRITRYPRRLNVKPGITGWAQVNGYRGETDTDEKMLKRVEHDLYYIDHWSLWLDLYIVFLTLFSKRAYANAR